MDTKLSKEQAFAAFMLMLLEKTTTEIFGSSSVNKGQGDCTLITGSEQRITITITITEKKGGVNELN